jgi:hypothetical protein
MYRLSACLSVGAMVCALVSAPLFHYHDRDDYNPIPLIHAHFPDLENGLNSGDTIETRHSHQEASWIDVLTLNAPVIPVVHAAAELTEPFRVRLVQAHRAVLSLGPVRAHSPPGLRRLAPRSPPSF